MSDGEDIGDEPPANLLRISEVLLSDHTLADALRHVAELAVAALPGCDSAGITLVGEATVEGAFRTDPLSRRLDELQYDVDEGPCPDAIRSGAAQVVDSMPDETRWPRLAPLVAHSGVLACLALPLSVDGRTLGALNLYSQTAAAFDRSHRRMATVFASHAAAVLANALAYAASVAQVQGLYARFEQPEDQVEQAKGVLMARHGVSAEAAAAMLLEEAARGSSSIEGVARQVIASAGRGVS